MFCISYVKKYYVKCKWKKPWLATLALICVLILIIGWSLNTRSSRFARVKITAQDPNSYFNGRLQTYHQLPLGDVIRSFGISFHCYADDTQLYIPVDSGDSAQIQRVESCLAAVKGWMSQNFLQLNTGKTELIIIGSKRDREEFEDVSLWLDGLAIPQRDILKLFPVPLRADNYQLCLPSVKL